MDTYAVTPTLFVGDTPPPGVEGIVYDVRRMDALNMIDLAAELLLAEVPMPRAVLVPSDLVAFRVLVAIGLSIEEAQERCDFALRMIPREERP